MTAIVWKRWRDRNIEGLLIAFPAMMFFELGP